MPRTGRGGRRVGTPGASYANRSDLNTRRVLPAQTATGLPYGEAGQLKDAQQAVPMASAPPTSVGVPSTGAGPPSPTPSSAGLGGPGQPTPEPGQAGLFTRPTERPDEPVSAGAPFGPGPNSVPSPVGPSPLLAGVALLGTLGDAVPEQVKLLRAQAQAHAMQQAAQ